MGHTNSTANLSLPQFIGTDKPTWLGDVNGAFSAIDAYAGTNDAAVAAAVSDASSAISQAAAAVNTANTANTTAGNASTAANNAIGVANTANAIAGTVDAKVGLLADLNTTDRTSIVNAINEVNAKGATLRVASSSSGTYADKLAELTSTFAALSDAEKAGAYIELNGVILRCSSTAGKFINLDANLSGYVLQTYDVTTAKAYSNVNGTASDASSTANTAVLNLYA